MKLRMSIFANHRTPSRFLCPACFPSRLAVTGQNGRGATKWGQAKMARRQTETNYLKEVLVWLKQYWTE